MNAEGTGCSSSSHDSPSAVTTYEPWRAKASTRQALARRPSTSTVQAPHWPWSQPFFAPVRSRCSRSRSSSEVRLSTVSRRSSPFTVTVRSGSWAARRSTSRSLLLRPLALYPLPAADALEAEPGEVHHAVDHEDALDLRMLLPPDGERLHGAAELLGEHLDAETQLDLAHVVHLGDRLGRHEAGDCERRLLL